MLKQTWGNLIIITVFLMLLVLVSCQQHPAPSLLPPTPIPTPPVPVTPIPSSTIIKTQTLSDLSNDLFDKNGKPVDSEAYLDIVETELSSFDTYYLVKIKVRASLPNGLDDASILIGWGILVDVDCNSDTGWKSSLMCNDTGPDYLFRLQLMGSQYRGRMLDFKANNWGDIEYKFHDDTIELHLPKITLRSDSFNYIFDVRKYGERGAANALLVADKAPNKGHRNPADSDGDGLIDEQEKIHDTRHDQADTDVDSASDYGEIMVYKTDPLVADKWNDFDTVTSILNTPDKIQYYMEKNIEYDFAKYEIEGKSGITVRSAKELFSDKKGLCGEYSKFTLYCLQKNGFHYNDFESYTDKTACNLVVPKEHMVTIYIENGKLYVLTTGAGTYIKRGPFSSVEEAVNAVMPADWQEYWLIGLDEKATKKVKR